MRATWLLALGLGGGCIIQQAPPPPTQVPPPAAAVAATTRPYLVRGMGFVHGLQGRGDSAGTIEAVYTPDERTRGEIRARNWALVSVTAQIPAGTRPGDRFPILIAACGDATSLAGGALFTTDLKSAVDSTLVVGQALGAVTLDPNNPTSGEVAAGGVLQKLPGGTDLEKAGSYK